MNVNATVFVQAINFFIVYFLLRFFLFRPVVSIIDKDHEHDMKLLDSIDQQKQTIAHLEQSLHQQRMAWHDYFQKHRPCQRSVYKDNERAAESVGELSFSSYSDDEIVQYAQSVYRQLEEKIKNVN